MISIGGAQKIRQYIEMDMTLLRLWVIQEWFLCDHALYNNNEKKSGK